MMADSGNTNGENGKAAELLYESPIAISEPQIEAESPPSSLDGTIPSDTLDGRKEVDNVTVASLQRGKSEGTPGRKVRAFSENESSTVCDREEHPKNQKSESMPVFSSLHSPPNEGLGISDSVKEFSNRSMTTTQMDVNMSSETTLNSKVSVELGNGIKTGSSEKSMESSEESSVPIEGQSKNSNSIQTVNVEHPVNSDSAYFFEKVEFYYTKIKSIGSELDFLFQEVSKTVSDIKRLRDEKYIVELKSLENLQKLRNASKSYKIKKNSELLILDVEETFKPKAPSDEDKGELESQTLLQLRKCKSDSMHLATLQAEYSHKIVLIDELLRLRSSIMEDLNELKSGQMERFNVPQKDGRKTSVLSNMNRDPLMSTEIKTDFSWENQPVLTKPKLTVSLDPLLPSKLVKSKWVEFAKERIRENSLWAEVKKTNPELMENVDAVIQIVTESSEHPKIKVQTLSVLVSKISRSLRLLNSPEVGKSGFTALETYRLYPGGSALENMSVFPFGLSTQIDELSIFHSQLYEVLGDLCNTDSAKNVIGEVIGWIGSLLTPQENGIELESQFDGEIRKAHSSLIIFFKEMGKLDSKITPLYEQVLQHEYEKAALSRQLTRFVFEHPIPKVVLENSRPHAPHKRINLSNTELVRRHIQQRKRMSTVQGYRKCINECQLELLQGRELLVKQKSELQERFKEEFKSEFQPAARLGALRMQKVLSMAQSNSLNKRKSELMACLKLLSKHNSRVITQIKAILP